MAELHHCHENRTFLGYTGDASRRQDESSDLSSPTLRSISHEGVSRLAVTYIPDDQKHQVTDSYMHLARFGCVIESAMSGRDGGIGP